MTYVVTDACIRCKYMDCVEVCPVDCFYEGDNMLVINPSECIDCGVCEPECPAEAILPDTESGLEQWLELNTKFSAEAEHHHQEGRAGRRRRVQGRGRQVREVLLARTRRGRLIAGLGDSRPEGWRIAWATHGSRAPCAPRLRHHPASAGRADSGGFPHVSRASGNFATDLLYAGQASGKVVCRAPFLLREGRHRRQTEKR